MSTSQPPPGFSESDSPAATQPETATQPQTAAQPQTYEPTPQVQPTQTATRTGGPSGPRAGFWRRFAAALIDGIIVGIPVYILEIALKGVGYVLGLVVIFAYYSYFEGGPTGAGYGKRAMGIRVIDFDNGGPIGHGRAAIRVIGRWISAICLYIGYLWMLWDKEKQCWHDKMANDVVVPTDAYPVPTS